LQNADYAVRKAEAFGHNYYDIVKQGVGDGWILPFYALVSVDRKFIKDSGHFRLDSGTTGSLAQEPISPIVVRGPRLRTRTDRPPSSLTMIPTLPSKMKCIESAG
jgi:hypothetical protein